LAEVFEAGEVYFDNLVAASLAADQVDLASSQAKGPGDGLGNRRVGLAVDGAGADPDSEHVIVCKLKAICPGVGMGFNRYAQHSILDV
jgi:hypothetical protein